MRESDTPETTVISQWGRQKLRATSGDSSSPLVNKSQILCNMNYEGVSRIKEWLIPRSVGSRWEDRGIDSFWQIVN